MKRRTFLGAALAFAAGSPLSAAPPRGRWDDAAEVLERATAAKQVDAAVLHVVHKGESFTRHFGKAASADAMFLLGSISKPINVAAVMTLFDQGKFRLDDRVKKFLPAFTGDGRDAVTVRHLLTHTSGLPDQLANNDELRKQHAPLTEFADEAVRTRLDFAPGTRYQYSSMGILLAARIAEVISGSDILHARRSRRLPAPGHEALGPGARAVQAGRDGPLPDGRCRARVGGRRPAGQGVGLEQPLLAEAGRPLGRDARLRAGRRPRSWASSWGPRGKAVKPETARLMVENHNPEGLTPRGLGFGVGKGSGSPGCSERTFGHTGSTGTLCWADPATETVCVVLTSLPRRAAERHPRELAAERVAAAARL